MIEFYIPFRIRSQIKFCKIKESGIVFRKKASKVMKNIIMNYVSSERTKQMEEILNFQKPSEGLELVILLHTQY